MEFGRSWLRSITCCMVSAALMLAVTPALASADAPTVVGAITFHGVSLQGMTADEASAAIAATASVPVMAPIVVKAMTTTFTVNATGTVSVNVGAMVSAALAATDGASFELPMSFTVSPHTITTRVAAIAKVFDRKAVDARRSVSKRRFSVVAEKKGRTIDQPHAVAAIVAAIVAEAEAGGAAQPAVVLPVKSIAAKVTRANIGMTVLVVLGQRKLYLYKDTKLVNTFRCAVGQPAYPTPVGTFKVVSKNPHPSWTNPGDAWSVNMPAYIPPGPDNPLGLRALYLNVPGIRIHGTVELDSIGHAESHGCIRLRNSDIVKLYPKVPVGTPVYIVK